MIPSSVEYGSETVAFQNLPAWAQDYILFLEAKYKAQKAGEVVYRLNTWEYWRAGKKGYLPHSSDSGKTWVVAEAGTVTDKDYVFIQFLGKHGIAIAENGVIAFTIDRGQTWGPANISEAAIALQRYMEDMDEYEESMKSTE